MNFRASNFRVALVTKLACKRGKPIRIFISFFEEVFEISLFSLEYFNKTIIVELMDDRIPFRFENIIKTIPPIQKLIRYNLHRFVLIDCNGVKWNVFIARIWEICKIAYFTRFEQFEFGVISLLWKYYLARLHHLGFQLVCYLCDDFLWEVCHEGDVPDEFHVGLVFELF